MMGGLDIIAAEKLVAMGRGGPSMLFVGGYLDGNGFRMVNTVAALEGVRIYHGVPVTRLTTKIEISLDFPKYFVVHVEPSDL